MCTRYIPPAVADIERAWRIGSGAQNDWCNDVLHPLGKGAFVVAGNQLRVGQWGLIPPTSPTQIPATPDGKRLSTVNARRERVASAPSYRGAWRLGQRCLIPAASFDEPNWASGKCVWWRFSRADGQPLALAGLWSEWTNPGTGELVQSYTMLTQNCDNYPVLNEMHRPDPKLAADAQDKRTVVPIALPDWQTWLQSGADAASDLIRLPALGYYRDEAVERLPTMRSLF